MAFHKLVGGRCHGTLIECKEELGHPERVSLRLYANEELGLPEETVVYELQYLVGKEAHPLYAAEGMDDDQIIERLLK